MIKIKNKHLKIEININESFENFNKEEFFVEFNKMELYHSEFEKSIKIDNRFTNIFFKSINEGISLYLFILNDSLEEDERIDILLEKGYSIKNIDMDISYERDLIEDYVIIKDTIEQVNLLEFLTNIDVDITNFNLIKFKNVNQDLKFSLLPINDDNEPIFRKQVFSENANDYGIEYKMNEILIKQDSLISSFPMVNILLICNKSIIAPKDLDFLKIKIGHNIYIEFSNEEKKSNKVVLKKNGDLYIIYKTPFFKKLDIIGLCLGNIYKEGNCIFFKNSLSYLL